MLDVISLVNFDNPRRTVYLDRSFADFYRFNPKARHLVFDSSRELGAQSTYYNKFGVRVFHRPGVPYGERLREALQQIEADYFLFLPDDFSWIFDFPIARALEACRVSRIDELKLCARGLPWYSQPGAAPQPWFDGARVMSGEVLQREGELFVSRRRWMRDFHEQFSLACNILQTDFAREVVMRIPPKVRSPGEAEKHAYVRLLFRRYATAYYKMWVPAFHFIDLSVEGDTAKNREKAVSCLCEANFATYNRHYNI